jgi:hypothetical protein
MEGAKEIIPSQIMRRFPRDYCPLPPRLKHEVIDLLVEAGWLHPVSSKFDEKYRKWWLNPSLGTYFPELKKQKFRELEANREFQAKIMLEARQRQRS